MSTGVATQPSSLPLDGHETVLDKYMSELDLSSNQVNSDGFTTFSPIREATTGKIHSWSVLGDPREYEAMIEEEEEEKREDAKAKGVNLAIADGNESADFDSKAKGEIPEEVATVMKEEEAFAPAIYKAYKDCIQDKKDLLGKVEHLRLSRSQQLQLDSHSPVKLDRSTTMVGGEKISNTGTATTTLTGEREKKNERESSMTRRHHQQTIGDKIIEGSQVRALREYEKFTYEWTDFKGKVSTKVGRLESDLVFERGPEFRRKKEELEMLELAIPTHERHGADQWTMSLRNNWTRYVPVGNIFSGLFCPVEDKPTIEYLEQITKPIHAVGGAGTGETTLGKTFGTSTLASRGRSWLDSKYLQRRRTQYSKNIAKVRQHSVGADTISVVGESIESRVEEQALTAITVKDVEEKLSQTNPAVWELIRTNRQVRENFSTLEREHPLKNASGDASDENECMPKVGPYLDCSTNCLEFPRNHPVGKTTHRKLVLTNKGTTAVKYYWKEQRAPSIFDSEKTLKKSMFFLSKQIGVILPGESKDFDFGFNPACSGQFWSKWELQTIPKLPNLLDLIVLKGSATVDDFADEERVRFIANLKEKIKERVTTNEVQRIVNDIDANATEAKKDMKGPVSAEHSLSLDQMEERAMFVGANVNSDETYFYMPEEFAKLKDLFDKHLVIEKSVEETPESSEEPPSEEAAEADSPEGEEVAEDEAKWDGSVQVLVEAVDAGKISPDSEWTLEQVKSELDSTLTKMKIPSEEGMVAYNIFYSVLGSVADAIEESLFEEVDSEAAAEDAAAADPDADAEEAGGEGEGETAQTGADEEAKKAEDGQGEEEEGEKQEGEETGEEEPQISEAKLAAIESSTKALAGIDSALADVCVSLGKEFETQYSALKVKAEDTSDPTNKQSLLWEMFELSRARTNVLGPNY